MARRRQTAWERDNVTAELHWHNGGPFPDVEDPTHRSVGVWIRASNGVHFWLARSWTGAYDRACEYGYLPSKPIVDNADAWHRDWLNPDPQPLKEPEDL